MNRSEDSPDRWRRFSLWELFVFVTLVAVVAVVIRANVWLGVLFGVSFLPGYYRGRMLYAQERHWHRGWRRVPAFLLAICGAVAFDLMLLVAAAIVAQAPAGAVGGLFGFSWVGVAHVVGTLLVYVILEFVSWPRATDF